MLVTVAICTWNRQDLLDLTLSEMHKLEIPSGIEWELLVVNNNCTDNTDDVLKRHSGKLPIKRLLEKSQGHSHARNCAIDAAQGELILWTDDDVLVDSAWLAEHVKAAEAWPDASFFGGRVEPHFFSTPPNWLSETLHHLRGVYALVDFGDAPLDLDRDHMPVGANFSIRTDVQRRYRYDPRFGRKRTALMSADETTVIWRILDDGLCGRWVPAARIRHCIPDSRQTLDYVRRFFLWQGRFSAIHDRDLGKHRNVRDRLWILRQVIKTGLRYPIGRLFRKPDKWVYDLTQFYYHWGRLLG